jgi:UDP-3-O-[3-hydroxymyristoyl] glucosamine N-acyltransferase
MAGKIGVSELVNSLGMSYKVLGRSDKQVLAPVPLGEGGKESLSFCTRTGSDALEMLRASKAGVVICSDKIRLAKKDYQEKTLIQVANPRLAFIRLLQQYFTNTPEYGIHPTAIIDPKARVGEKVFIGPYACIGECQIGEETIIQGNVHILSKTIIGKRVSIDAGTVIGTDGFGFERNEKGELEKFPQIGGVVIEDDVEIGSNVSIDRGSLANTIIGRGTKIDNLCHIAHNVVIGKHCVVIALSMIGGSTRIGDYSHVAPSASIMNKVELGKNVLVGLGAVVTKSVADNLVVKGVPAKPVRKNI